MEPMELENLKLRSLLIDSQLAYLQCQAQLLQIQKQTLTKQLEDAEKPVESQLKDLGIEQCPQPSQ
jgi:hypothetical protein